MVERALPLAASHQGSRVTEKNQAVTGTSQCQGQCLRTVAKRYSPVDVAAGQTDERDHALALPKRSWDADFHFDLRIRPVQGLFQQTADQLSLCRIRATTNSAGLMRG